MLPSFKEPVETINTDMYINAGQRSMPLVPFAASADVVGSRLQFVTFQHSHRRLLEIAGSTGEVSARQKVETDGHEKEDPVSRGSSWGGYGCPRPTPIPLQVGDPLEEPGLAPPGRWLGQARRLRRGMDFHGNFLWKLHRLIRPIQARHEGKGSDLLGSRNQERLQ